MAGSIGRNSPFSMPAWKDALKFAYEMVVIGLVKFFASCGAELGHLLAGKADHGALFGGLF